jgi:hypothetical protein
VGYSYITFGQARTALANRLYDSTKQFWSDDELASYIVEALRTFNAFAGFQRQSFTFNSRPNVTWYDLTDSVNLPNTLRSMTVSVADIVSQIEYHLLEPQTTNYPLTWAGSKQFAIDDILSAIQQARDEFISDTGCTVFQSLVGAAPGLTVLDDKILDVRRVCWIPASGFGYQNSILLASDIWAQQSFEAGFPQTPYGYPVTFRRSTEPPISFAVDIQPAVPGQYDILTINAGETITAASASIIQVPNDWAWCIKWGALAQLLSRDSSARDVFRANYCLSRYQHGIAAVRSAPALLSARINDVPTIVDTLTNGDFYSANWQGLSAGTPDSIYYSGLNMLAISRTPDAGPYSVTADVVANMPVPTVAGDEWLQIGRDDLGPVLDYAQHMAMFKCGGIEFISTKPLLQNFMRQCQLYNSKIGAQAIFLEYIDGRGYDDQRVNPLFSRIDPTNVSVTRGRPKATD